MLDLVDMQFHVLPEPYFIWEIKCGYGRLKIHQYKKYKEFAVTNPFRKTNDHIQTPASVR